MLGAIWIIITTSLGSLFGCSFFNQPWWGAVVGLIVGIVTILGDSGAIGDVFGSFDGDFFDGDD